jgi:hypothetical protein
MNTKHIIEQKNLTDTNLNTISKQSTKIEKQIQKTIINLDETTKSTDLNNNNNNNNNNIIIIIIIIIILNFTIQIKSMVFVQ